MLTARGMTGLDRVWLVLMAVTLLSAWLAESAEPSLLITLTVVAGIGLKGLLVVDHLMGLRAAHPLIRLSMRFHFYLLPLLMLLVYLFPQQLAELTRL